MTPRLLITTKPALCTVSIAFVVLLVVSREPSTSEPSTPEPSPPEPTEVVSSASPRPAVPTPETPFSGEDLSAEHVTALIEQGHREKRRYLADCSDRGGRSCCGQGGCCGVPDTVLNDTLRTNMPFVFGELSTAVVERRLNARAQAITTCYTREHLEPSLFDNVFVELEIGRDGRVSKVEAGGFDTRVASCVAGVVEAIEFPRPAHGTVSVRTSFEFHDEKMVRPFNSAYGR